MRFLRDNPGETEDKNQKTKTKRPLTKDSVRRSGYEYGF